MNCDLCGASVEESQVDRHMIWHSTLQYALEKTAKILKMINER